MASYDFALMGLIDPIDPEAYGSEIARLKRCRSVRDLERLATAGWLSDAGRDPRLKLIRHGSGTFLVVAYDKDGWSTRVSQADFPRR